jgi:hypothetical protein
LQNHLQRTLKLKLILEITKGEIQMDLDKIANNLAGIKTAMDRPKVKQIRAELEKAMKQLEPSLGMTIQVGGARFSAQTCTFKIDFVERGVGGEVQSKEAINFKTYAKEFGLEPDDLGKEVIIRGKKFTITGLNPRQYKFPVLGILSKTGTTYKLPIDDVLRALGKKKEFGQEWKPREEAPKPTEPMNFIPDDVKHEFNQLANNLSPENLAADGERSRSQQQILYRKLTRRWRELEQTVGRKVTEEEVYSWFRR